VAETRPGSTQLDWSRYKYRQMQGLIIAAGTRSGQIRVWSIDEGLLDIFNQCCFFTYLFVPLFIIIIKPLIPLKEHVFTVS